jgi:hypothetical protein
MLVEFLTKTLQGQLFWSFRDALFGIRHTTMITDSHLSQTEERVGIRQTGKVTYDDRIVAHDIT